LMRDVCRLICLALIGLFRSRASLQGTHTGKAAGLSQARERWRVYDVAREVQAAC
jgi:hypothetical protein